VNPLSGVLGKGGGGWHSRWKEAQFVSLAALLGGGLIDELLPNSLLLIHVLFQESLLLLEFRLHGALVVHEQLVFPHQGRPWLDDDTFRTRGPSLCRVTGAPLNGRRLSLQHQIELSLHGNCPMHHDLQLQLELHGPLLHLDLFLNLPLQFQCR